MAFNLKFNFMKNMLFTLTILFSLNTFSQGNLQFNRVINFSQTETVLGTSNQGASERGFKTFATLTIPEGKVWKITYANVIRDDSQPQMNIELYTLCEECALKVGDLIIYTYDRTGGITSNHEFPVWLNSGQKKL